MSCHVSRTTRKIRDAATLQEGADTAQFGGSWRDRVVTRSLGGAITQSLDRADQFMRAARELMAESGETVTVQEIADRAGMSLRLLYRYFKSKDDLVAAVLEEAQHIGADHLQAMVGEIHDPPERARTFLRAAIDIDVSPLNEAFARHESMLVQTDPDEVARAQQPVAALAESIADEAGTDPGTGYLLMAAKRSYNWSRLLGDSIGIERPAEDDFVQFFLIGMGLDAPGSGENAGPAPGRRRT